MWVYIQLHIPTLGYRAADRHGYVRGCHSLFMYHKKIIVIPSRHFLCKNHLGLISDSSITVCPCAENTSKQSKVKINTSSLFVNITRKALASWCSTPPGISAFFLPLWRECWSFHRYELASTENIWKSPLLTKREINYVFKLSHPPITMCSPQS